MLQLITSTPLFARKKMDQDSRRFLMARIYEKYAEQKKRTKKMRKIQKTNIPRARHARDVNVFSFSRRRTMSFYIICPEFPFGWSLFAFSSFNKIMETISLSLASFTAHINQQPKPNCLTSQFSLGDNFIVNYFLPCTTRSSWPVSWERMVVKIEMQKLFECWKFSNFPDWDRRLPSEQLQATRGKSTHASQRKEKTFEYLYCSCFHA